MNPTEGPEPLWRPPPDARRHTQLGRFWHAAEARTGRTFADYAALHRWSVDDREAFWGLYAEFAGIDFDRPAERVKGPDQMPGTQWFPGARLNYAENLLRRRDDHVALIAVTEQGVAAKLSYRELHRQVACCADAMRAAGITTGDRVAGMVSNGVEAVVAFLASASIGAIWSACSPDFGAQAAIARLGQIAPKLLIASAAYRYGGCDYDCLSTIRAVAQELQGLERVVLVTPAGSAIGDPGWVTWSDFVNRPAAEPLAFTPLPFDHPLYILYSSGTTGPPKCMVHGAGGSLLQHRKEHQLHTDVTPDDVMIYVTTCGWMMWNWLVSGLATGCTLVLYDGSAAHPGLAMPWELIDEFDMTIFGTSAPYLETCMRRRTPTWAHPSLRVILSTGSPLSPAAFRWTQAAAGPHVRISSIAGGTDIVSCFVLGNPLLPVYAGEIQCLGLGMDVAALDAAGRPVIGAQGELVCRRPFPSMPVRFWNDPAGKAYRRAYFETYPGVWHHGDFIEITPRGGVVMYGRSDATLNPGGVRIGTAEIYRPLEQIAWVADALAAGMPRGASEDIALFVVVGDDKGLSRARVNELLTVIRREASPRHVPRRVLQVPAVPRTRNGKLAELAATRILRGESVPNRDALTNPECLDAFARARYNLVATQAK